MRVISQSLFYIHIVAYMVLASNRSATLHRVVWNFPHSARLHSRKLTHEEPSQEPARMRNVTLRVRVYEASRARATRDAMEIREM